MHKHFSSIRPVLSMLLSIALLAPPAAFGRTRKGDVLLERARQESAKDNTAALDTAYRLVQEALATDRNDIGYQLEVNRLRSFSAQYHVYDGQLLREKGRLTEAIAEFEKAIALDPASIVGPQELTRTKAMMKASEAAGGMIPLEMLGRPLPRKLHQDEEMYTHSTPVPQLKVTLAKALPIVKVNNQGSSEVFLTLGREAKIRVLFDSEYQNRSLGLNQTLDFQGLTLEQALDYVALLSKSFWKALAQDTIFIANDDQQRRASYEEQITKAFYLTNAPVAQEVTDIANTIQRVTDIRKLFVHPAQNVIIARGDADRIALAEKVAADLDKPKAEIIIDVMILSVNKGWTRNLGVGLSLDGLSAKFAPGTGLMAGAAGIPLSKLSGVRTSDYSMSLPSATLSALLQTAGTKVLDKAELRTVEGQRSSLKIGTRVPYATGSYQASASGGGVNTQFQYFDIGLNIDVIAKVHEPDEVSLHIESDTSSVTDRVDLGGGISQPVIAQRKRVADVRVKEGEINFWDIVTERQEVRNTTGVPGLSQIPGLGRIFTQERVDRSEQQVLTLLTPHIIRAPDIRNVNLMGVPSGNDQTIRMRYSGANTAAASMAVADGRTVELLVGSAPVAIQAPGTGGMPMQTGTGMGGMQAQPQPGMGMGMGGVQARPTMAAPTNPRVFFNPAKLPTTAGSRFTAELTVAETGPLNEAMSRLFSMQLP